MEKVWPAALALVAVDRGLVLMAVLDGPHPQEPAPAGSALTHGAGSRWMRRGVEPLLSEAENDHGSLR